MPSLNNKRLTDKNMLILTRRIDESIIIDDDISVTVLSIKGRQVRIGVVCPKVKSVHRSEIYDRIKNAETVAQEVDGETEESEA